MKGSEKDRRRKSTPATAPPKSSGAPSQSSKPSGSSSQPSRAPPQASKEPSQPDKAPAQPEKAPAQPEKTPAQPEKAPPQSSKGPARQLSAPAEPSNGPPQKEKAPAQTGRDSRPPAKTRSLPSKASRAQPQPSGGPPQQSRAQRQPAKAPLRKLLRVASVACGIQFGWALQLSLLTPYVQELGIPHAFASVIWLCGPISGFFVQPLVGHLSDRCTNPYGRRRPFIIAGAAFIVLAVLIVGHSADIGWMFGDTEKSRVGAIVAFVVGFWLLDVANNVTQGPCRALLGDLTGNDQRRTRVANAYFSLFMAVGNILGFATGSYAGWYRVFPFTITTACGVDCANLKSAFFLDIIVIAITTYISILAADEIPLSNASDPANEPLLEHSGQAEEAFFWEIFGTFKYLPGPVWIILLVTALTWIGWFPFLLYDTDWMGREIYGGEPNDGKNYNKGVRMGATGLMLNSVFLGVTSLLMEVLCRRLGAGVVWGMSNILMTICFIAMIVISYIQNNMIKVPGALPSDGVVAAALVVFAILGIPLAITYSVPYALVSSRIESLGLGQGLSMGVLNLAIVVPQIIVSIGSGPWDALFGGGNSPAIAVAAIASFVSGLIAILAIPRSRALEKSRSRR